MKVNLFNSAMTRDLIGEQLLSFLQFWDVVLLLNPQVMVWFIPTPDASWTARTAILPNAELLNLVLYFLSITQTPNAVVNF
jgi:isoprenylcysteine carboxyl methyltransferase (ICMT) family protein YpbQ